MCGRRHHNCFAITVVINGVPLDKQCYKPIQGFIINIDRFVRREEASKIAFEAKQINESTSVLFSEDLY